MWWEYVRILLQTIPFNIDAHINTRIPYTICKHNLPAWWFQPLWKISKSVGWWHSHIYMEIHKIHVPNHQPAIIIIKDIQEIFRILWVQIRHYHEALGPWNPWDSPGMLCIVYSQDVDAAWHASTEVGVPNDSLNDHDLLWFSMILYWKQPWWLGDPAWLKKPARYIYIYIIYIIYIYICVCVCIIIYI